jgi:tRNA threonylcarbamoyladenosine modification (KEOPS) complex  Pcc1 subunit
MAKQILGLEVQSSDSRGFRSMVLSVLHALAEAQKIFSFQPKSAEKSFGIYLLAKLV